MQSNITSDLELRDHMGKGQGEGGMQLAEPRVLSRGWASVYPICSEPFDQRKFTFTSSSQSGRPFQKHSESPDHSAGSAK